MLSEQRNRLIQILQDVLQEQAPGQTPEITLERPKAAAHGDIACTVALQAARLLGRQPRELAQSIAQAVQQHPAAAGLISQTEVAGPGFINFRLSPAAHQAVLDVIESQGPRFGHQPSTGHKIMVEFVSANPTGPLHVGHARQAALGDALCRLFASQGAEVCREFYYNDAGNQIDNLALSVQARGRGILPDDPRFPADGYRGDYIHDIAQAFLRGETAQARDGTPVLASRNLDDLEAIRQFAVIYLRHEQDLDLQAFGLDFDNYYLESSLYSSGKVEQVVQALGKHGHTYEKDGALWLRTTELGTGDDKDRVMRKSDGSYTYFVPDVAYHVSKWQRGYRQAINIQGVDHHGTMARVRAGLQGLSLGIPPDYPAYIMHKMVRVMREGQEVKISKRSGNYVTMRDLIEWAGRDAVRFFLVQRKADAEFTFDIDLALAQNEDNPVYYVQYAHARIHSLLRQGSRPDQPASTHMLTAAEEIALLKRLAEYPGTLAQASQELAPHQLAFWLRDCAADFHAWYNAERIWVDDPGLCAARLRLAAATAQVIANGLELLGVSAPERM